MALHFPILINQESIGNVIITRQGEVVPGIPSSYKVVVDLNKETFHATVTHLYEAGALALIQKALSAVNQLQRKAQRSQHETKHSLMHGNTHVPGSSRYCGGCTLVTRVALKLSRPQRNLLARLGGQIEGTTSYVRASTVSALHKRGLVTLDPQPELTPAGRELFYPLQQEVLQQLRDRAEYRRFRNEGVL